MRRTLAIDECLLARAAALTGIEERSALVRKALRTLIERKIAWRLARLGHSETEVRLVPRRWVGIAHGK